MDANLKTKWVEALRSGRYKRTTGVLKDGDSYCCLGVLCEVMGANWLSGEPVIGEDGLSLKDIAGDELLNERALRRAALPSSEQTKLTEKNDSGASFTEIAKYIEANL